MLFITDYFDEFAPQKNAQGVGRQVVFFEANTLREAKLKFKRLVTVKYRSLIKESGLGPVTDALEEGQQRMRSIQLEKPLFCSEDYSVFIGKVFK